MISAGAGLHIGRELIFAGDLPRAERLRVAGRESLVVLLGCVPFILLLGVVEGFVSPSDLPFPYKLAIGVDDRGDFPQLDFPLRRRSPGGIMKELELLPFPQLADRVVRPAVHCFVRMVWPIALPLVAIGVFLIGVQSQLDEIPPERAASISRWAPAWSASSPVRWSPGMWSGLCMWAVSIAAVDHLAGRPASFWGGLRRVFEGKILLTLLLSLLVNIVGMLCCGDRHFRDHGAAFRAGSADDRRKGLRGRSDQAQRQPGVDQPHRALGRQRLFPGARPAFHRLGHHERDRLGGAAALHASSSSTTSGTKP